MELLGFTHEFYGVEGAFFSVSHLFVENLTITVKDQLGSPIQGAKVSVLGALYETDALGMVELLVPAIELNIKVTAECYSDYQTTLVHTGAPTTLEVTMITPPCLSNLLINEWSFMAVRSVQGLFFPLETIPPLCSEVATCGQPLPRDPDGDLKESKRFWGPVIIGGETYRYFVGQMPKIESYRVCLLNESLSIIENDLGQLIEVTENGIPFLWFDFTTPTGLLWGEYRLVLYNHQTDQIVTIFDPVRYTSDPSHTALIKYSHSYSIDGFPYDSGFYHQIRLDFAGQGNTTSLTAKSYRALNTSRLRYYNQERFLNHRFHTVDFDGPAHYAMGSFMQHDTVYINARRYNLKQDSYQFDFDRTGSPISSGQFETELYN